MSLKEIGTCFYYAVHVVGISAMNNNLKIGGIFCDLQKAFDCVDHNILMNKLEFYDVCATVHLV